MTQKEKIIDLTKQLEKLEETNQQLDNDLTYQYEENKEIEDLVDKLRLELKEVKALQIPDSNLQSFKKWFNPDEWDNIDEAIDYFENMYC